MVTITLFNGETIVLSEKESLEFVNDLFYPDSDYATIFEAIDNRMAVSECEHNFIGNVILDF